MDILDDMEVSKLSAKVFFLKWTTLLSFPQLLPAAAQSLEAVFLPLSFFEYLQMATTHPNIIRFPCVSKAWRLHFQNSKCAKTITYNALNTISGNWSTLDKHIGPIIHKGLWAMQITGVSREK